MTTTQIIGHDGTSRGDDALMLARALAPTDARRIVVHVIERALPDLGLGDRFYREVREQTMEELSGLRDGLQPDEELRIVEGDSVASALDALAARESATLVVVGPSHRGAIGRALMGTTADRLLHGSPCPVAVATQGFAEGHGALRRILLAYDDRDEAKAALVTATTIARQVQAVVDVVCVRASTNAYAGHPGAAPYVHYAIESAERQAQQAAAHAMDALPDDVIGTSTTTTPGAGHAIVDTAAVQQADLIVLGSRAYGPVKQVLLGSTGRYVLHHAPCAVLVVPRQATTPDRPSPARDAVELAG